MRLRECKLIAGIDDAGRGAIIGPLVIAGILLREDQVPILKEMGVADSKSISKKKRSKLAKELREIALNLCIIELSPAEIDNVVKRGTRLHKLNRLEAEAMARIIMELKPDVAYVDASDVLEDRFGRWIKEKVSIPVEIISEHKADVKYPIVSAASILAKVRRDEIIEELKQEYGDMGSAYIADPKTKQFLFEFFKKYGFWPSFVRKSWKPLLKIEAEVRSTSEAS